VLPPLPPPPSPPPPQRRARALPPGVGRHCRAVAGRGSPAGEPRLVGGSGGGGGRPCRRPWWGTRPPLSRGGWGPRGRSTCARGAPARRPTAGRAGGGGRPRDDAHCAAVRDGWTRLAGPRPPKPSCHDRPGLSVQVERTYSAFSLTTLQSGSTVDGNTRAGPLQPALGQSNLTFQEENEMKKTYSTDILACTVLYCRSALKDCCPIWCKRWRLIGKAHCNFTLTSSRWDLRRQDARASSEKAWRQTNALAEPFFKPYPVNNTKVWNGSIMWCLQMGPAAPLPLALPSRTAFTPVCSTRGRPRHAWAMLRCVSAELSYSETAEAVVQAIVVLSWTPHGGPCQPHVYTETVSVVGCRFKRSDEHKIIIPRAWIPPLSP